MIRGRELLSRLGLDYTREQAQIQLTQGLVKLFWTVPYGTIWSTSLIQQIMDASREGRLRVHIAHNFSLALPTINPPHRYTAISPPMPRLLSPPLPAPAQPRRSHTHQRQQGVHLGPPRFPPLLPSPTPAMGFHEHPLNEHMTAVKALAWHVSGAFVATGGARRINASGSGTDQRDDCQRARHRLPCAHELVSTHGFSSTTAQNQICIWKYLTLYMVASLTAH
ncbi:hypothetical protein C0992_006365 [Termitomyces sp. T32_za158]|nr:hypothetical protein C0992_006365 [Termitomyces sp. T32_za158]